MLRAVGARMRVALRRLAAAATLVVGVVIASPASPGPPSDAVRASLDRLLVVMNDSALKTPERAAERYRMVKALAEDALDFKESARRALGPHWDARTPAERERFVRLFTDLIDHAYLTRLSVDGEKIVLDGETVDGVQAVVKGRALSKSGGATPVEFYLDQDANGGWRLYDVSFEGISLIGNYRAQFNKIIRTSSFEELANLLEAKTRANAQATTDEQAKTAP
jgi:phospholipid transport system substrate-binding protein